MPRFDQTGPMGQGSMTGHKMGKCTNFGAGRNRNIPAQENPSAIPSSEENGMGGAFGMRNGGMNNGGRGRGVGRGVGRHGQQ